MPATDRDLRELREEVRQLRHQIIGDPTNRDDGGLRGDMAEVKQALYGPPNRPNGLVGYMRTVRNAAVAVAGSTIAGVILYGTQQSGVIG